MGLNGGMGVAGPIYTPCRGYAEYADSSFRHKGSPSRAGAVCAADMQDAANSRHRSVSQLAGIINLCARCWHPGCGSTMTLPDRISATRNIIASY